MVKGFAIRGSNKFSIRDLSKARSCLIRREGFLIAIGKTVKSSFHIQVICDCILCFLNSWVKIAKVKNEWRERERERERENAYTKYKITKAC
jgi:hypothetical protein